MAPCHPLISTRTVGRGRQSAAGFGFVELFVTVALFGILVTFAAPRLSESDLALAQSHAQLTADLRMTRASALVTGDHFRLDVIDYGRYVTHRLSLVDTEWTAAADATRDRTLPAGLQFTRGVGATFEFNTRGGLVDPDSADVIEIADARTGFTRRVTVWPSGQVLP